MKKIILFASGNGTNAENIIKYFKNLSQGTVSAVFVNNPNAKVITRAKDNNVDVVLFDKQQLTEGFVLDKINEITPDLIVLAGFLWMFPSTIIKQYPNKVINIHPALLPKYGGKGMYGKFVHEAVLNNKETETGITIHYVNEHYDEGTIIFQAKCEVNPNDSAEDVAAKIHELEMAHFPRVVEQLILKET